MMGQSAYLRELHFIYDPQQRKAFKNKKLGREWNGVWPYFLANTIFESKLRDGL